MIETAKHVPALDGIRGLAILLVLGCHFTATARPLQWFDKILLDLSYGGWIGVDLFFVLSGFLISRILLSTKNHPSYFHGFYIRRVLRIFPVYFATLITVFWVLPTIGDSVGLDWRANITVSQLWFWTFTSNLPPALSNDWPSLGVLGHLWSLAVEEQFYLFWPAVVLLLPARRLLLLCAAIIIGSLLLRVLFLVSGLPPLAGYVLTPARFDTFAIGALVAIVTSDQSSYPRLNILAKWTLFLSVAGCAALYWVRHPLNELDPLVQTVGYTLLCTLFASLIALSVINQNGGLAVALSNNWLRAFGKYSYAIYMVHPLIQASLLQMGFSISLFPSIFGSIIPSTLFYSLILTALSFLAAVVSWHLLEKHFLRMKDRIAASKDTRILPATQVVTPTN